MKPRRPLFGQLRAQFAGFGGTVVDVVRAAHVRRTLDEQLHHVDEEMRRLLQEVDTLKAQRFTTRERLDGAAATLAQREAQVLAALQAGRHDLAREVAAVIVSLERDRDADLALLTRNDARLVELRAQLYRGENLLRRLRHELDLMRAADAVSSAEQAFSERMKGHALGIPTAIDSAELLRSRQAASTHSPAQPPSDPQVEDAIDKKLREAGLAEPTSAVDRVLGRIAAGAVPVATKKPKPRKKGARTTSDRRKDTL